ncbi:conserved hypothetical protein [Culex quinquefasciatus]|uniref:Uncharacterized protein n=2 Tax=Culex quinquefasciatus TaxID=7176 RepID=B0W7J1_CULQU|nr:conserved hypothetical protein [Culex quinquefasciatus]|eukprot:XP_001844675.1 conserved hypothetical protein [Culex quinquefasciatus]
MLFNLSVETVPAVQLVQGQFQVVAQPPPPPQLVSSQNFQQQQPQPSNQGGQPAFVPNNVIDNFFIPPGQQNPQQNGGGAQSPIVGLFNQIGNKLATTADAIAGMLRKTVDVIVTSHIQSHQRALRSFGAQLPTDEDVVCMHFAAGALEDGVGNNGD